MSPKDPATTKRKKYANSISQERKVQAGETYVVLIAQKVGSPRSSHIVLL